MICSQENQPDTQIIQRNFSCSAHFLMNGAARGETRFAVLKFPEMKMISSIAFCITLYVAVM